MTLEDTSLSLKHAEVSLPVMVGLLQTSARARQMSCAYYVTFPDANLLTLETNTALPRESFCFSIRWLRKLSQYALWTLSEGSWIQNNKPAFPLRYFNDCRGEHGCIGGANSGRLLGPVTWESNWSTAQIAGLTSWHTAVASRYWLWPEMSTCSTVYLPWYLPPTPQTCTL